MQGRRWALGAVAIAVAVLVLAGLQMYRVHQQGWEWGRLTPSAAPPLVHYLGRDYQRSEARQPSVRRPGGFQRQSRTPGGGTIYAPDLRRGAVPTALWVRDGDGYVGYGLKGGP